MTLRGPHGRLSKGLLAACVLTVLPSTTPASAAANPSASKCGVEPTADRNAYFAKIIKQNDDSENTNDFRRALACSQWLVDVFLKAPDIDAYNQSAILFRHAENLKAVGRYIEADPVYRRALSLQDENPADPDNLKLKIMGGLADNDAEQRKYTEAAKLDGTALDLWSKKYGPDGQEVASASDNLGIIYDYMGRYAEAEPLHQKALDIRRAAPTGNEYALALGENNFAFSYHQRGDYAKAEEYYRKASDLYLKIGANHDRWAIVNHVNLANLYADEHRLDLAENLYKSALKEQQALFGDDHPETLNTFNDLGALYIQREDFRQAIDYLTKAMKGYHAHHSPLYGTALNSLAVAYADMGLSQPAIPLYKEALTEDISILGAGSLEAGVVSNNLAGAYSDQGKFADALQLYQTTLRIYRNTVPGFDPRIPVILNNITFLYLKWGKPEIALGYAREAIGLIRSNRQANVAAPDSSGRDQSIAMARTQSEIASDDPDNYILNGFVRTASLALAADPKLDPGLSNDAFEAAQDGALTPTGRAAIEAAARRRAPTPAIADLVGRQQQLTRQTIDTDAQITSLIGNPQEAARFEDLQAREKTQIADLTSVDAQLAKAWPEYTNLLHANAASVTDIQQNLGEDQALVMIVPYLEDNYVFMITRSVTSFRRIEGGNTRDKAAVSTLLCQIDANTCRTDQLAPSADVFDQAKAYQVYQDTLQPAEAELANVKRLYVASSGAISRLPLGILVTKAPKPGQPLSDASWLADRFAITVIPSASAITLADADAPPTGQIPFVGYGEPRLEGTLKARDLARSDILVSRGGVYTTDPSALRTLQPLPGTGDELRRVAKTLHSDAASLHLLDADTETILKSDPQLARARIISIATHGLMPDDSAKGHSESGLVFTPPAAATPTDDGLLTASEIVALHLNADWIILSACNTATSDNPGDSFSSLSRALLFAGAHSILASHWRVDDAATSELIDLTLKNRNTPGVTRSLALQRAEQAVRAQMGHQHPRYWAPFSVIANSDQ